MSKQDERLAEMLSALDEGAQPESVFKGEGESNELASLVNLAVSIRELPHPELDRRTIQSDKRKLVSAAREKTRSNLSTRFSNNGSFTGQWLVIPAVAGVALIMLMVFVIAAGAGLYFAGPRGAQAAVLTDAVGVLEVSDSGVAGNWHAVSNGDKVRTGQRLRTGDESWVTLEFFEGTRTTLAPNTDVVLDTVDGNWGNELQVELIQNRGETNHEVIPLRGDLASYQVLTPSGEASVRGTSFSVLVEDSGTSLFAVETGEVLVSNDEADTYVAAGQGVVTELGAPLAAPTYLFALQGKVEDNSGKTWVVEGVEITVKGGTRIYGDPQVGELVLVNGRITKDNEWIADSIQSPLSGDARGTFTGVVTSVVEGRLEIDGYNFTIGDDQPQIAVGDLVRVTFTIEGNVWTVFELEILNGGEQPDQDNEDGDTTDPDEDLNGQLFFGKEKEETVDCEPVTGSMREFTTTLNYIPAGDDPPDLNVWLTLSDNGDELDDGWLGSIKVSVDGTEFVDLSQAITLHAKDPVELVVTVTLGDGFNSLPPGGKLEIKVMAEGDLNGVTLSDTYEIEWKCDQVLDEQLFFNPGKEKIVDCEPVTDSERKFTTTLNYVPPAGETQSLAVKLTLSDYSAEVAAGWLESITISKDGAVLDLSQPITLLPGDSVQLVVTVNLATGFDSLPPETKLEIRVGAEGILNDVTLGDTYKIKWECDEEIPEDELPDETPGKEGHYCTTDDQHPKGLKLVGELYYDEGVIVEAEYSQIMEWFCNYNLGFGEIDLMMGLSYNFERDIDDVLNKRIAGYGWGQIKHQLAEESVATSLDVESGAKKEPPGKQKSEDAKNKDKPDNKNKKDK
jgi:hypothetical protein